MLEIPELVKIVRPYSMATEERLTWMAETAKYVIEHDIPGDFVECGVCNGGSAAILAHYALPAGRKLHLFDSFAGLPAISGHDAPSVTGHPANKEVGKCVGSVQKVLQAITAVLPFEEVNGGKAYNLQGLNFIPGWFHETFPLINDIKQVAMLNLDSDWYESETLCWQKFYPSVVQHGFVYIDDYAYWPGCRKACRDYLTSVNENVIIHEIGHSAWIWKGEFGY